MSRVLLLFLTLVMSSVAFVRAGAADVVAHPFGLIPSLSTESGKRWQLRLRIPSRDGIAGRITASHLPDGANLRIVDKQWVLLSWQPSPTQSGRYHLTLTASFGLEEPDSFHQVVEIVVLGHEQPVRMRPAMVKPRRKGDVSATIDDALDVDESLESAIETTIAMIDPQAGNASQAPADSQARTASLAPSPIALATRRPVLERMATQIVSVGRTVSFDLRPVVAGGRVASVHVDRLPRNASFERNLDGSRTFFWPTGHLDQGEHVFRFTANHPDDPSLLSYSEAVIIVGDPSKGSSAPRLPAPPVKVAEVVSETMLGKSERQDPQDASINEVDATNISTSAASADPFSDNFDPSLDRDLAPELEAADGDELELDDEWVDPE